MVHDIGNEICDECAFDGSRWSNQDAARTVGHAADLVVYATEGLDPSLWNQRADPQTWSVGEYVDHLHNVFAVVKAGCELALTEPDAEVEGPTEAPVRATVARHDPGSVVEALSEEATTCAALFESLEQRDWDCAVIVDGQRWTIAYAARHLCHDLFHHFQDIADLRRRLGDDIIVMRGEVASLQVSRGGVPKTAVPRAMIDAGGLVDDRQASRRHHGRPFQALCLYSAEVIEALQAEGHPIQPGSAGENVTVRGIDWATLRAGLVIEIGDARCRLSAPATPCAQNHQWFSGTTSMRISHERHPGWSRWYASVLQGGPVSPGDVVVVRP